MPKLPVIAPGIGRTDVLLARAADAERDGRRDDAIQLYRRVLDIDPTHLHAINQLGVTAGQTGDLITAIRQFANSSRIDPGQPDAWFNLAVSQSRLGQIPKALASIDRMIALAPRSPIGHLERAANLARLGRHEEARAAFDETVRLAPNDPAVAGQRGWTLQWCGKYDEAFAEFDRAIALYPDFAEAWLSKAMLLLRLGNLASGFALYEWRWRLPHCPPGDHTKPLWLGDTGVTGKTLLIYGEQGLGDGIQFCRYATLAANAGVRVIAMVPPELVRLLATMDGVSQAISDRDPPPEHDVRCPMMSLPLAFGTTLETIPANIPYLQADPSLTAAWRRRLTTMSGLRIGLVWAGSARFGDAELMATDQRRSLPLADLAPLASVEGCSFVSLQLGPPAGQAKSPPARMMLHDHTSEIHDFLDTAALLENLDLVIGVDTSVVHLAGAMGKPVWLLNRFDACWRWMLDRGDSPWYPTMRIFRQPRPGDWASVVRSVTDALRLFVTADPHRP
jgi:Flp pilus assembly protein TadD